MADTQPTSTIPCIAVLIPAYEPDERLVQVVHDCLAAGLRPIVVVDDGSSPGHAACFQALTDPNVTVLHHPQNRGKGAAIKTGIAHILEAFPACAGIVTADADGQHAPEDVRRVAEALAAHPDSLVLGSRTFSGENIPWTSRAGNTITSCVFRLITGRVCADTQTGLRGIPAELFSRALEAEGERYDYEMNFLLDTAERGVPIRPVPIRTIYLDNNRSSHFRVVRDSILIYRRPVLFALGALASAGVDLAAFWCLLRFAFGGNRERILLATVLARLLSGCVNFLFNKKITFRSEGDSLGQAMRYIVLFFLCMFVSGGAVELIARLPVLVLPVKILVDALLFLVNYLVERKWVFRKR